MSDDDVDEMSVAVTDTALFAEGATIAGIEEDVVSIDDAAAETLVVVEPLLADIVTLLPAWAIARVHVFTSCIAA